MRRWPVQVSVCLALCSTLLASPTIAKLPDIISLDYNKNVKVTIVYANEKLIDGTTSIGASYSFDGHQLKTNPKTVDLTVFGYHDEAKWQSVESVTVTYDGKTYTTKALHALHGEERDKSADLVEAKYYEVVDTPLPFDIAHAVFNSEHVTVASVEGTLSVTLTNQDMDRQRDLLQTVHEVMTTKPPTIGETSNDGLPTQKIIGNADGRVTYITRFVPISDRFQIQGILFQSVNGRKAPKPTAGIMVFEVADEPVITDATKIAIHDSDGIVYLDAYMKDEGGHLDNGYTVAVRSYYITYNQFQKLAKSNGFTLDVGGVTAAVPKSKMSGIRELARMARSR